VAEYGSEEDHESTVNSLTNLEDRDKTKRVHLSKSIKWMQSRNGGTLEIYVCTMSESYS